MKPQEYEPLNDVMARMQRAQAELTPLNEEMARIDAERQELLSRAVQELGDRALGTTVTATNITQLQNWRVLEPFNAHNASQASGLAPSLRSYVGARDNYYAASTLTNPASVTGEVVGIDVARASLVLKPKILRRLGGASRYWVHLVDKNGTPYVHIDEEEA